MVRRVDVLQEFPGFIRVLRTLGNADIESASPNAPAAGIGRRADFGAGDLLFGLDRVSPLIQVERAGHGDQAGIFHRTWI